MSLLDRNPELDPHSNASETMGRRVDIIYAALKGIEKSLQIDTSQNNSPVAEDEIGRLRQLRQKQAQQIAAETLHLTGESDEFDTVVFDEEAYLQNLEADVTSIEDARQQKLDDEFRQSAQQDTRIHEARRSVDRSDAA